MTTPEGLSAEAIEKSIKELADEYNSHLEELGNMENRMREHETESFNKLKKLYAQVVQGVKEDPVAKKDYQDGLTILAEHKDKCYAKQTLCFHQIQKLRTMQTNYLVGIVNGLQKELEKSRSSTSDRVNNLPTS